MEIKFDKILTWKIMHCATVINLKMLKSGGTLTGNLYFDGSTRSIRVGGNNLCADNYFRFYLDSDAIKYYH